MGDSPGAPFLGEAPALRPDEKIAFLRLARASLRHWLESAQRLPPEEIERYATGDTGRRAINVFVSIHKKGELRGCIGTLQADKPLVDSLIDSAIGAGTGDCRFDSVILKELDQCDFEISVLGQFEPIQAIGQIEVGRHGILVEDEAGRGLLLPQVARSRGWDAAQFLRQTYLKAGLNARKPFGGERISVFETETFGEKEFSELAP